MFNIYRENIIIALRSIRGQLLRTILTILIIAFGIMSLVGMLTGIDVLNQSINENFSFLGTNTFSIRNRGGSIQFGHRGQRPKTYPKITFEQAMGFKDQFAYPDVVVSVSANASGAAKLKRGSKSTNPNIPVIGGDENYLVTAGYELGAGRNFSADEIRRGINKVIIGAEIKNALFGSENAVDKDIFIGTDRFTIVGILAEKGSSAGLSNDRVALIPVNYVRQKYQSNRTSFVINVFVRDPKAMESAIGEATGLFRTVRKDQLGKEESFEIEKSDELIQQLTGMTAYISVGSVVIAMITLLGALIGLLNIMLVSVTERTREIGVRKAIGATRKSIAFQFLIEAIVICQLGGILGVFLGMLIGNMMTLFIGGSFIVPWNWTILAVVVCFLVGVGSGLYPAFRAARLDVVESLRYE